MCERTVTDVFSEIITSNKTLDIGSHCFDVRKHLVMMVSCNYANLWNSTFTSKCYLSNSHPDNKLFWLAK